MTSQDLERAALDAHRAGERWSDFWRRWGPHAIALEPHDRQRFKRLTDRLLALLVAGNLDGSEPPDATPPWEVADEASKPPDTGTAARCLWTPGG